jgi:phage/plasmid-associated DNA primase
LGESELYKKIFDECYKPERFEQYEYWKNIGMAIKNTFNDENQAFELFNYYSSKGRNYEGFEKTRYKFTSFERKDADGYTVKTIHFYAIEDNKSKFIEIMNKNTFELGQTDMCKYLKTLVGYKFIYKKSGSNYKLYCYNGKYWENDDILLKNCISTVLYDFLKMILIEVYWNCKDFSSLKSKIEKLKLIGYKKDIVETYKEYGVNNEIMFDEKWWLFGFTNCVYDMKEQKFRDYYYDDYISITCGFDWREPTQEELKTVNDLIISIMPIKEEREAYLDILCTALDGRCLEKFIIFNGCGGNGKGVMNDLMLVALGNYGLLGNNGILFETSKTGSNPEKANMHKKRYVVFREPPEKNKFENSIIKELTGGGSFSARGHHETETEKELNLTMVVECNKRPIFNEEPKEADVRRIIDMLFRSTFVTDKSQLDENKYIYYANSIYKTKDFQQKHKYALLKILMDRHKIYLQNESIIQLPPSVVERTNLYLELSCNIVQWFKNNYVETNNNKDVIKIKDVFDEFSESDYFFNLSKMERRKYNKAFFVEYFETNIFLRKYYKERHNNVRNVLLGWTKVKDDQDD